MVAETDHCYGPNVEIWLGNCAHCEDSSTPQQSKTLSKFKKNESRPVIGAEYEPFPNSLTFGDCPQEKSGERRQIKNKI